MKYERRGLFALGIFYRYIRVVDLFKDIAVNLISDFFSFLLGAMSMSIFSHIKKT